MSQRTNRQVDRPEQVIELARAMAPSIAGRAAEVERARRVPPDLLDELVAGGCFRMLLPRSHGGLGADLPTALRLFETLAEADASVGWTVMIGGAAWLDLATLPRASFDALFPATSDVIVAGAFNPTGQIVPTADGYRVTGRWGFVSGCEHATWLYGNCVEGVTDGTPMMRLAVFAPDQVKIEDTWNVLGLCGTGSHHITATDVTVPAARTGVPLVGEPCLDEPIVRIPVPTMASMAIATIAIGTARAALDDVVAVARQKVPLLAEAPLATDPLFRAELAEAHTGLREARCLLDDVATDVWTSAVDRRPLTLDQRSTARAAAVRATDASSAAVRWAYRSGGSTSLYADSPLQRRLRDLHTLTQHFLVRGNTMATVGAVLTGERVQSPVF